MTAVAPFVFDLVAIGVLIFALYLPRHRRTDMVVAYLVVNIATLAVATTLASSQVSAGLGLGIFGVLSIIRLRSLELDQQEVAYYFAALALGLLGGIDTGMPVLTAALMATILLALFVGDHPRISARSRRQHVILDRAIVDERDVTARLEELFGATVAQVKVRKVDLVSDTTDVEARFDLGATPSIPAEPSTTRGRAHAEVTA